MNEQNLTLELSKGSVAGQIVRMGQGDSGGTTIVATVYDNGTAPSLTGATAAFFMRVPDRVHYVRDVRCTVSGNVITYVVDESHCCAVAGYTDEAYFEITKDGRTYSTSRFRVKIERAADDGAELAEDWDNAIEAAIDAADEATETANAAAANAAATAAGIDSRISAAAHQAADEAASEVEQRVDAAIDAMGDISELAVPEMSADVRGGAKLEEHGGLALRDGSLGIGSLVQESDGYARGGLAEVTAKGHAEQVATTGKNLLDSSGISNAKLARNADGSITVKESSSSNVGIFDFDSVSLLAGATYTMSHGDSTHCYLSTTIDGAAKNTTNGVSNFTPSEDTTASISLVVLSTAVVGDTFYPQLELGSTATSYEPYTGGAPSPSPDYPQEIQVVRGRNLIDENLMERGSWSFSNGTPKESTSYSKTPKIECEGDTEYVVSAKYPTVPASSTSMGFLFWDKNGTFILSSMGNSATSPSNARYMAFDFYASDMSTNPVSQPQLTLGSTPQPYVPYGHVGLEVQGKNLFGGDVMKDVILRKIPSASWNNALQAVNFTAQNASNVVLFDDFKPNTVYTFVMSGKNTNDNSVLANLEIKYTDGTITSLRFATNGSYSTYINTSDSSKSIESLNGSWGSLATYLKVYESGIFEGIHTIDEFEPYFHTTTPIPLPQRGWVAGLPDGTADSLTLDGAGKCEWVQRASKLEYDGSSFSSTGIHNESGIRYGMVSVADKRAVARELSLLCDMARCVGSDYATSQDSVYQNTSTIVFNGTLSDTAESLKSKFDGAIVLYPLATPVTEDCGYVDMPAIPSDCTITIPELDALGIRYFVDDTVTQYGREIYARVRSEYADRIEALEAAVADLVTA